MYISNDFGNGNNSTLQEIDAQLYIEHTEDSRRQAHV